MKFAGNFLTQSQIFILLIDFKCKKMRREGRNKKKKPLDKKNENRKWRKKIFTKDAMQFKL